MRIVRAEPKKQKAQQIWNLCYLEVAAGEGRKILTDAQYEHLVQQLHELALESDPARSKVLDIRSVNEFFELRDKGGILGRINMRVFFFLERKHRAIVVLGAFKKENENQTPVHILLRMRNRLRVAVQFMEQDSAKG